MGVSQTTSSSCAQCTPLLLCHLRHYVLNRGAVSPHWKQGPQLAHSDWVWGSLNGITGEFSHHNLCTDELLQVTRRGPNLSPEESQTSVLWWTLVHMRHRSLFEWSAMVNIGHLVYWWIKKDIWYNNTVLEDTWDRQSLLSKLEWQ